jgi:hypothetical protein
MTSMSIPHKHMKSKFHIIIIIKLWPMKFMIIKTLILDIKTLNFVH